MSSQLIKTYNDLLREEQNILLQFNRDKESVFAHLRGIRKMFLPAEKIMFSLGRWMPPSVNLTFLSKFMDIGLDLVSKKYIFKKAGWMTTFMGTYMVRILSQILFGKVISRNK